MRNISLISSPTQNVLCKWRNISHINSPSENVEKCWKEAISLFPEKKVVNFSQTRSLSGELRDQTNWSKRVRLTSSRFPPLGSLGKKNPGWHNRHLSRNSFEKKRFRYFRKKSKHLLTDTLPFKWVTWPNLLVKTSSVNEFHIFPLWITREEKPWMTQ